MISTASKNGILSVSAVIALAFIMLAAPASITTNAFAQGNDLNQGIGQSQASTQLGICVSGDGTLFSCNNLSFQNQDNEGNNAAAQSSGGDDDDDDDGNSANQGIGQSQSSDQSALCVSGEGTFISCNNINVQNQENEGNNAAAQSSGNNNDDDDNHGNHHDKNDNGNSASQGIGQSQDSDQRSNVASGDDSEGSGNNVNVQNQDNEGNNAAAQDN
jgi:hypothetical protein